MKNQNNLWIKDNFILIKLLKNFPIHSRTFTIINIIKNIDINLNISINLYILFKKNNKDKLSEIIYILFLTIFLIIFITEFYLKQIGLGKQLVTTRLIYGYAQK